MDASSEKNPTTVERKSDCELVFARTINGPVRLVYDAWTKPALFKQWWAPKSFGITIASCDLDVRVGGKYRVVFEGGMAFFGTYLEVVPQARLVWTNEEAGEGGPITTVTFEEHAGKTRLAVHELHASKESLDDARASGAETGTCVALGQLEELLATLGPS